MFCRAQSHICLTLPPAYNRAVKSGQTERINGADPCCAQKHLDLIGLFFISSPVLELLVLPAILALLSCEVLV